MVSLKELTEKSDECIDLKKKLASAEEFIEEKLLKVPHAFGCYSTRKSLSGICNCWVRFLVEANEARLTALKEKKDE